MDASQITTAQRITVIKHSLNGRSDDFIAVATGLTTGAVNHILDAAGSPNKEQMKRLLATLERHDQPTPSPVRPAPRPTEVARPAPTPVATPDSIANLLAAAHQHDKPAIRKQAEKIDTLLARLLAEIKADREDAARRKEIADLKARLAQLEGKKPKAGTVTKGEFRCATCDSAFDTKQGVTLHHTRVHRESA